MRIGDTLRKAAGLLVEFPEDEHPGPAAMDSDLPPARTVEQIVKESPGPNLNEVTVPPDTPPPTPSSDGKSDFTKIYQQANLPVSPFTAEQVLDLINQFPVDLPIETKRQTVKVTLNAMSKTIGVTP